MLFKEIYGLCFSFAVNKSPLRRNDSMHRNQPLPMRWHRYISISTCMGTTNQKSSNQFDHPTLPWAPRVETTIPSHGKPPQSRIHQNTTNTSSKPPQVNTITTLSTHILHL